MDIHGYLWICADFHGYLYSVLDAGIFQLQCLLQKIILVGYAQTAAVGIVLLTGSLVYTELSGRSWTSKFDRKVCLFFGVLSLLFDVKG